MVTREIIGDGSIVAATGESDSQCARSNWVSLLTVVLSMVQCTRTGADHARMRKIISPAFSPGQLQSYYPQFRRSAWKVRTDVG